MDFFKDIKPLTRAGETTVHSPTGIAYKKELTEIDGENQLFTRTAKNDVRSSPHLYSNKYKNRPDKNHGLWFLVVISCIILLLVVSYRFSKATITITPKKLVYTVNETVNLNQNSSPIPYETISVTSEIKTTTKLSDTKVSKKTQSQGTIILYNVYSETAQKLVKGTRLSSATGQIYTLLSTVSIPGYKTVDSKKVPGQVQTDVISLSYGENTEIPKDTNLLIVAYKGTNKYNSIYGVSKTAISGGLNGEYFVLDQAESTPDLYQAEVELKLKQMLERQVPKEYVIIPGLYTISYDRNTPVYSHSQEVDIIHSGTLKQIIFKSSDVQEFLSNKYSTNKDTTDLNITSIKGEIIPSDTSNDLEKSSYSIKLSGEISEQYLIDQEKIKVLLAGKFKNFFHGIIESQSETIEEASLRISPFWVLHIPKTFNRIIIVNNYDR